MTDGLKTGGHARAELWRDGPNGPECVQVCTAPNTLLQTGMKELYRILTGLVSTNFDAARVGTCGAAAASNQSNVLSPISDSIATMSRLTIDAGRTWEWRWCYPSGVGSISAAMKEMVICSRITSPGGTALCRVVFSSTLNKTANDKIVLYYYQRAAE